MCLSLGFLPVLLKVYYFSKNWHFVSLIYSLLLFYFQFHWFLLVSVFFPPVLPWVSFDRLFLFLEVKVQKLCESILKTEAKEKKSVIFVLSLLKMWILLTLWIFVLILIFKCCIEILFILITQFLVTFKFSPWKCFTSLVLILVLLKSDLYY